MSCWRCSPKPRRAMSFIATSRVPSTSKSPTRPSSPTSTILRPTRNYSRDTYDAARMKKRIWRWLLIAALAVVVVGLAAPRVSANRFRPRIQAALEAALHRPVHLGAVHLNLFTGPGFTVDDVEIDDDPAAGIEPFAHVEHMQARIRWTSLFTGNLTFSSLRLDTPSVNVVKMT